MLSPPIQTLVSSYHRACFLQRAQLSILMDQFALIETLISKYPADVMSEAIRYCWEYQLYSGVDCRIAAEYSPSIKYSFFKSSSWINLIIFFPVQSVLVNIYHKGIDN